jgi:small GTP-binding protein
MIFKWKLVVLGDPSVGKTSLVRHFCEGYFSEDYLATIGVSFLRKELTIDEHTVGLQIWDLGGTNMFSNVRANYIKGSHGALVLFDLTEKGTLVSVSNWVQDVVRVVGKIPMIIIGNKSDLPHNKKLIQKAESLAQELGSQLVIASAKTGDQMNEAFKTISRLMMNKLNTESQSKPSE